MKNRETIENKKSGVKKAVAATALTGAMLFGGCAVQDEAHTREGASNFREGTSHLGEFFEEETIIKGPAIIKPNAENNDVIVVPEGEVYQSGGDSMGFLYEEGTNLKGEVEAFYRGDEEAKQEAQITWVQPEED